MNTVPALPFIRETIHLMSWMPTGALGIYISIPFCRSKCTYCNFASGVYPAREHERYIDRVIQELASARVWSERRSVDLPVSVDTVYLGGGTPSLLAPELIDRLFAGIRAAFQLEPDVEITAECAPGQIADATLEAFLRAGVNRVSLGVQSFIDREASSSGRLHDRATVLDDVRRLRSAGIRNLNVDLIAGLAGQTFASWDESLAVLCELDPPHASVYMLEVDEDSRLGREMLAGGVRYRAGLVPGDDAIARMYETAVERLEAAGVRQYEISNFAQPGSESRHNLRYWLRRPYLGCGLDASSMAYVADEPYALRWTTTDDLQAYIEGSAEAETAWLSLDRQHEEAWFLGLRLIAGVSPADLRGIFGPERLDYALRTADRLIDDGLLVRTGERIRLSQRGLLLSNDVFQEFLVSEHDEEHIPSEA